jgi:hypothetical protein
MNCPDCGAPVERLASFCPKCYARIEPPGLLRQIADFFGRLGKPKVTVIKSENLAALADAGAHSGAPDMSSWAKPTVHVLKSEKKVVLFTVDKDGTRHEYHSLDEVPLAERAEFERIEKEVLQETGKAISEGTQAPPSEPHNFVTRKTTVIYKIRGVSGKEQVYHSLEELPPEIREKIKSLPLPPGTEL